MDDNSTVAASTAAVQAVTENASRLGLTWDLRPATVRAVDPITGITVIIDGDFTPVAATSMVGTVYFGQRVYVILVPPGGVFIAGVASGGWIDISSGFCIGAGITNPTKGSGSTYRAAYQLANGTVHFSFSWQIGAGFAAGSGSYFITPPVIPKHPAIAIGRLYVQDAGTALLTGTMFFNAITDNTMLMILQNQTGIVLNASGPGTAWANGDIIQGSITYPAGP